jgi:UDP-sulfoquinovose synthase
MNKLTNTILILGGDGYLGWSLALAVANRTDSQVVIVDNLIKKEWERSVNISTLVKVSDPETKIREYEKLYSKSNLNFENIDLRNYDSVLSLIGKYTPHTIINAAQQPSAPFSMMSPINAKITFENNIETNLNVLWAISRVNNEIKYIKLGSAGSYLSIDADFIPKSKVDLKFNYGGEERNILNSWLPMQASDFYHQSKVDSFLLSDLCANLWGLKVITVQQSTIFGHTIPENIKKDNHSLMTRYNYDHIFGTVINRFVCQAVLNYPLTVYGDGTQKTGVISLSDAVDNFLKLIDKEVEAGQHLVEHNYTHKLSINEIAESLKQVKDIDVQYIENPRIEKDGKLQKIFEKPEFLNGEVNDIDSFKKELTDLVEFTSIYKSNIREEFILPKVKWKNN